VPVVLHTISSFKKELLEKAAPLVLEGVNKCIKEPGPLRNEIITSPDFWVILRTLSSNPNVAPSVFDILQGVVTESSPPAIMADNYNSAVELLNMFATAGSIGSVIEQKQDKKARRGQQANQTKLKSVVCVDIDRRSKTNLE
jgi:brefeldin A-resistance guanine nucleotide exchange factor 1